MILELIREVEAEHDEATQRSRLGLGGSGEKFLSLGQSAR
jgi:hypothetical protein